MKVLCTEDEWWPMADLDTDRETIQLYLQTPIKQSERDWPYSSGGPEYISEVTKRELREYLRLKRRIKKMSNMFLDRKDEREQSLKQLMEKKDV